MQKKNQYLKFILDENISFYFSRCLKPASRLHSFTSMKTGWSIRSTGGNWYYKTRPHISCFHFTITSLILESNQPNSYLYDCPYCILLSQNSPQTAPECLGRHRDAHFPLIIPPISPFTWPPGVTASPQPLLCLQPKSVWGCARKKRKKKEKQHTRR